MSNDTQSIIKLYDERGTLYGVLLDPAFWREAEPLLQPLLAAEQAAAEAEMPEPIADWNMLLDYWDFQYEPDAKVECAHCGAATEDWTNPEGKNFRLKAANLGGLVNFQCMNCKSRVIKRHFKDHYKFECKPHMETKR